MEYSQAKATTGCTGVTIMKPQIGCSTWTTVSLAQSDSEFAIS
jgi:hypothetical protein